MTQAPLGFIGIGSMGEAMALRLIGAGRELVVWNRTRERCAPLAALGATIADSVDALFSACDQIILMLANAQAIEAVLGLADGRAAARVRGKAVIQMGTILPDESMAFAQAVDAAGGVYVEAPVSGSRKPAEAGQLVAMVAGPPGAFAEVRETVAPVCRQIIDCGAVPKALAMKLSVNIVLVSQVAAFAEAVVFARANGVDLDSMAQALLGGPMANDLMRVKLPKLLNNDMRPQASIRDVHYNCSLILQAAGDAGAPVPLVSLCERLYRAAKDAGHAKEDMVGVVHAIAGNLSPDGQTQSAGAD
jgi:3-hydroxyisobutyrate dehydrogenase